jgi:Rps23 Pro-64 3,4-dihydroxylase Tpa1-like proline 4-hydroxylase
MVPRWTRAHIAGIIANRLAEARETAAREYRLPGRIPSFIVDDLLPSDYARAVYAAFPAPESLVLKRTLGQLKYVGYQMNAYDPLLEEAIYGFQDARVLGLIAEITGLAALVPDESLYAGGISLMTEGHFLNPHLDNSHNNDRTAYRVLNLLYYVSPDWRDEYGGHLELWDDGPGKPCRTVHSRFNRLVVMQTDERSWHSVGKVTHGGRRCCVSNYYFSPQPVGRDGSYHVTSFRGWPGQTVGDALMRLDSGLRLAVRRIGGKRLFRNPHVYRKP